MKNSFWKTLPKPFFALAPLDGVTDVVFRQIITEIGKPDVMYTEFTPCGGLLSPGRTSVEENFLFTPAQKPIVAQIWGHIPYQFEQTARELVKRNFDGIDINMGCPDRSIIRDGACSALIKDPKLAKEIIESTKKGAGDVPVSVKTRLGFYEIDLEWIKMLLKQNLASLSIHLRTASELSKGDAHWDIMHKIVTLRNEIAPDTLIIGNGDIGSLADARNKYKEYGCEGFMVGRGIFANPWVFNEEIDISHVKIEERIELYLHHIDLFKKQWGDGRHFALLKKFAKTYMSNFPDAANLRDKLMESKTLKELEKELLNYKTSFS